MRARASGSAGAPGATQAVLAALVSLSSGACEAVATHQPGGSDASETGSAGSAADAEFARGGPRGTGSGEGGPVEGEIGCPPDDALCATGGYAHFRIPSPVGGGLPHEARYEVSDQLVHETVSGLWWERFASVEYSGWDEAVRRCAELELAGRDDFRLPGRIELVTLLDFSQQPAVAAVFDDAIGDYHWTSSKPSFIEGLAYSVYFGAGEVTIANASPGRALSRCVAGDVAVLRKQFRTEADAVTDLATELSWELVGAPAATWDDAAERCATRGMRLPSLQELQSIIDERAHDPAIDAVVFPNVASEAHWTSSLRGLEPWVVDFTDGKTYADRLDDEQLPSRCVR